MNFNIKEITYACKSVNMSDDDVLIFLSKLPKKITNQQNKALHLLFNLLSDELNNIGITFFYRGISGKEFELIYTPALVKDYIWKPLQQQMLEKESTTELSTKDIDLIFESISNFFSERYSLEITFPSIKNLIKN